MKHSIKTIITSIVIIGVCSATQAAEENEINKVHDLPTFTVEDTTLPVVTKAPTPRVRRGLAGTEVTMLFRISDQGLPKKIRQKGISPNPDVSDLAATMTQSIQSWRFEPAQDEFGKAIAVDVALPVKVVRNRETGKAIASINAGKLELIRRIN